MRIEYISHSCFVIETGDTKIAFDPWITGTAYDGQWHLHPRPVDSRAVETADAVLISHGHEDHFHPDSLKMINKNAHVFVPFQWRSGMRSFLGHLGFSSVTEAVTFKTCRFRDVLITYVGYSLESVVVVECEGYTIVNINDALNSNHENAVAFLLERIKERWPGIDFLFSGWSGAGYFPNKVHYRNKDDHEVARVREQYFADNMCRFTRFLQPKVAVPFAPGFVLLSRENLWINKVKFPRENLPGYYSDNFEPAHRISFAIPYPGDYFMNFRFFPVSTSHTTGDAGIYDGLKDTFASEIPEANDIQPVTDQFVNDLAAKLRYWLNKNSRLYDPLVITDAIFSVCFLDALSSPYFNIRFVGGTAQVERSAGTVASDKLTITTRAALLSKNLDKPWGGDLLSIGYGVDINVFDELTLEKNLDIVCVRLISRFPIFRDDMLKHTGRMVRYYLSNPALTNLWLRQKIALKPYVNKFPYNERDHWITYNKCDLCKVCKMPELDFANL